MAIRYSSAAVMRSKDNDVIAKKLCQIWIAVFRSSHKFLSDNGGEFSNKVTEISLKISMLFQLQLLQSLLRVMEYVNDRISY